MNKKDRIPLNGVPFILSPIKMSNSQCTLSIHIDIRNEPGHEKMCHTSYANNKGADQPAHPRSLISAFVVRCLDSVMSLVSVTKISSFMLASVAEQASLSLTWSETPENVFCHDEAQM